MANDLIKYYQDMLITQYRDKPKARSTICAIIEPMLQNFVKKLNLTNCFDLETATGDQLDIIGRWVGVPRVLYGIELGRDYFQFCDVDSTYNEMSEYNRIVPGKYKDYYDVGTENYTLNDSNMKIFIKMRIIANSTRGTGFDIDQMMYGFFGNAVRIQDNYNKVVDYFVDSEYRELFEVLDKKDWLPRPAGVKINVNYV